MADSKELRDLYVKRSSIKGQLTKFKNFLNSAKQKEELTGIEVAELSVKLGKLEASSLRFDDLQTQIEVLNSDFLQKELDERDSIENDFVVNIAACKKIIDDHNSEIQQRRDSIFHDRGK